MATEYGGQILATKFGFVPDWSLPFRIWWAYSKFFYFSVNFKLSGLNHRKHMGTQEDKSVFFFKQQQFASKSV